MPITVHVIERSAVTITPDDRAFFQALGIRISQLRNKQNITQVQLVGAGYLVADNECL
jgi:hypothetical protein